MTSAAGTRPLATCHTTFLCCSLSNTCTWSFFLTTVIHKSAFQHNADLIRWSAPSRKRRAFDATNQRKPSSCLWDLVHDAHPSVIMHRTMFTAYLFHLLSNTSSQRFSLISSTCLSGWEIVPDRYPLSNQLGSIRIQVYQTSRSRLLSWCALNGRMNRYVRVPVLSEYLVAELDDPTNERTASEPLIGQKALKQCSEEINPDSAQFAYCQYRHAYAWYIVVEVNDDRRTWEILE